VVYCSLDEPYARPVLEDYGRRTGVRVVPLFDTEAAKSVGLAQRIRAEAGRPRADVFWSSEAVRLIQLKLDGLLAPYASPSAADIPAGYRDPGGGWTGFAARARVMVYNTRRVKSPPPSILDLARPEWKGEVAICRPRVGTAATEAAALFSVLGEARARQFYADLKRLGAHFVDGNSVAAEWTARGETLLGMTDTDDAYSRQDAGLPLGIAFPDQAGFGTLLIPNTAGLVRGAPHPEQGRRFLDYLLSVETELRLARSPTRQIPLHRSAAGRMPPGVENLARLKRMQVNYEDLARRTPEVDRVLRETLQQ
jgi:iron(III) transport system substrate-binding protein